MSLVSSQLLCERPLQISKAGGQLSLCPVHTALFLYRNADLNLRFCETVHITPHKTEVYKYTLHRGHLHRRRLSPTAADKCECIKMAICLDYSILKKSHHDNEYFFLCCCEQCEPTQRIFYLDFCTEAEQC